MLTRNIVYLIIVFVLIAMFMLWQVLAYKVSEPNYAVLNKDDAIEIRKYPALLMAQVDVVGDRYDAINKGFRILADYIFGGNVEKNKIAMTAPVIQQEADVVKNKTTFWHIKFVMPSTYTTQNLPKPTNSSITILPIPEKQYVVIRFSGSSSQANLSKNEALLESYISKNKLTVVGQPIFAFYNPPWILPFLRRNEILLELKGNLL